MNSKPALSSGFRVFRDDNGHGEDIRFFPLAFRAQELAAGFPTLRGLQGVDLWDVRQLGTETAGSAPARGNRFCFCCRFGVPTHRNITVWNILTCITRSKYGIPTTEGLGE